ncbi:MAG: M20/M25/M40 family metallo-hydrolase, partial [Candidatus Cloacimonetes bacterium]|nr:M20/M25/M40 family metallo-hydrolase [Candidatus Cloacimonadota bacterium]
LPTGFIKLQPIGGWNVNTLSSSPVIVINSRKEKIPGIIGSVPVHFQKDNKASLTMENLFVDVGAESKKDAEDNFGIHISDQIVPVTNFHYSKPNNLTFSKAFDDRAGIAAIIETGKLLKGMDHPNTVFCTGSVQEEVGGRGAKAISSRSDADICLVLEGAPADDTPGISDCPQTKLGKGVQIRLFDPTMIVKEGLKNYILEIAEKSGIPHQITVRKSGGTDSLHIHTAKYGIPTMVFAVPVRYAHSHNCMMSMDDFNNLIDLLVQIIAGLDQDALNRIIA